MQKHYSRDPQVNQIVRQLVRKGWYFCHTAKHGRVIAPTGKKITVPFSPSDFRACLNFKAQIRREGGAVA